MTYIFKKLCFVTILLISPLYLYAYDFQVDGLYYNINTSGSSVGVTNGDVLYQGKIEIPSEVLYNDKIYDVTNIGSFAFANCLDLTSVTIPNSVIAINSYAFSGCRGMTSVNIPNSLKWIRTRAFQGCSSLTSVIIPNSVTFIDGSAFSGCSSLNSIMVDNGNSNYDSRDNCNAIIETSSNTLIFGCKKTVIPNSVTNIGNNAFSYCSGLTSLAIPDGVTSIGDEAFEGCSNLSSITIHDGVSTIGNSVFKGCTNLNSIILPNSVLSIGSQAFRECSSLKTIDIGNCVTSIGNQAFFGCRGINSFTIPNSVKKIDDYAFAYCSGLTTIKIPNSVTELGGYSFEECTNLTSVSISNSIKEIKLWTFYGCKNLKSVTIPNSVTTIGGNAFMHCTSLTSVDIPNSVTAIENGAFERCTGLVSVTLPNTVTTIAGGLFEGCSSLSSITIPSSINSIGRIAFYRCDALNSIISEIQEPFPLSAEMIFSDDTYSRAVLTVPKGTKAAYQSTEGWYKFRNIVEVGGVVDYTISITSKGNGSATYDGTTAKNNTQTITLKDGTSAIITFNPDNGYRIKYVKVNNTDVTSSVSNNQYTVSSISANTTVEVVFEAIPIPTYTLSITASGNGSVSYSGTSAKNNTKIFTVNEGTSAAIAFTPDAGYRIKSVKVNSTDVTSKVSNNSYTISSISANTTVEVVFEAIPIPTYTLSITASGNGSVSYSGTNAKNNTKTFMVNEGTSVSITFSPDNGYRIKSVKVNGTDVTSKVSNNSYTISSINANTTVDVVFEAIPVSSYTLKYIVDGETYKTYQIQEGATITPEAMPTKEGYTFSGWSEIPKTMPANDVTVVGTFTKNEPVIKSFTLTIKATGYGYASYSGITASNESKSYTLNEGTSASISFSPDNGYRIKSVKVNGTDMTSSVSNNSYTVSSIKANTTVEVEFEAIPVTTYNLTIHASGNGSAVYGLTTAKNNSQTITVNQGTSPTITFFPDNGYRIKSVKVNSTDVTSQVLNNNYTISGISADTTVEVEFEAIPASSYTLKYVVDGDTYKTYQIQEGAVITPEAEPEKEGYTFSGWSAIPVTMPAMDVTITGSFTKNEPVVKKYTLTITATGNGYASYCGITASNESKSYTLNEGTSASISFSPDKGYRIKSVKVNSTDVTSKVSNNSYTISNINANTMVEVEFEAIATRKCTLTLKAMGNGSAWYNGVAVTNSIQTFSIEAGALVIISFLPSDDYNRECR